jgi:hypothetical protein
LPGGGAERGPDIERAVSGFAANTFVTTVVMAQDIAGAVGKQHGVTMLERSGMTRG